jgi:two-component system sensor histidine kinase DesK
MSPTIPAAGSTPRVGDRALARSVTATWWYTFGGLVFFGMIALAQWSLWILLRFNGQDVTWRLWLSCAGGVLALAGVMLLLRGYRPRIIAEPDEERPRLPPLELAGYGIAAVSAVLLGVSTGSWMAGLSILAFSVSVRPWLHGIRWRVILALTVVLVAVWIAEAMWAGHPRSDLGTFLVPALFTAMLPLLSASSLWWWDIVLELDRARQAESLLAATRERLRLANDVHDLQGHHLQVIALQLELAQRLMQRDPDAAAREIERARAAVDDARQGTRDLAAAFRGVPLPDELENAADLLRSAGLDVQAHLDPDAATAPADVLGPIVRESVTNVLKHGDGRWARLSLERLANDWVYRIANDDTGPEDVGFGSGLSGMTERAHAADGDVRVRRGSDTFELTVSLPAVAPSRAGASA